MKKINKLLSGIMALVFCFSLIAPAAQAVGELEPTDPPAVVEEQPVEIADPAEEQKETEQPEGPEENQPEQPEETIEEITTFAEEIVPQADVNLTLSPSASVVNAGEKIHVTVDGVNSIAVMDITYAIEGADGKLEIDKDGRISFVEGYKPSADVNLENVKVTATVDYYDGADVLFSENFACSSGNITEVLTFKEKGTSAAAYTLLTAPVGGDGLAAHTGPSGVTMVANDAHHVTNRRQEFDTSFNGLITFWYYDALNDVERTTNSAFGLFINPQEAGAGENNPPARNFFGVAHHGTNMSTEGGQYAVRNGGTWGALSGADAKRSEGWHKFQYLVETDGTTLFIDDKEVGTIPTLKSITSIGLGTNNGKNNGDGADSPNGYHFIDDISVISIAAYEDSNALKTTTATCTVDLLLKKDDTVPESGLGLGFTSDTGLQKGMENERVYLTGVDGIAIESATYSLKSGATGKVTINPQTGAIVVKEGATVVAGDKVEVEVAVEYYTDEDDKVAFVDNFVGEQNFRDPGQGTKMYTHSTTNSLYGLTSATFTGATSAGDASILSLDAPLTATAEQTYTAWAWLYDNGDLDDNFYRLAISVGPKGAAGMAVAIMQANSKPVATDPATVGSSTGYPGKYVYRNNGASGWFHQGAGIDRVKGWHKIIWEVSTSGAKTSIQLNGTGEPQLIFNDPTVTSIQDLKLWTNWSHQNQGGYTNILDKYFYDGFTVIADGAATTTETRTIEISLADTIFTTYPLNPTVDSTYAEDLTFTIAPNPGVVTSVELDGVALDAANWETFSYSGPANAGNYPTQMRGFQLKLAADAIKGLANGEHILTLTLQDASSFSIGFTAAANTHVARDYYVSNNDGDDNNTGLSEAQAWKSFDKLNTVTFGPGDRILLDATSMWNGVHFMPNGSGAVDAPIVMTSYGGNGTQRPILNGGGTVPDFDKHDYLAFLSHRKFFPSGTVELYNVEHWEVRGLEITNYASKVNSITHFGVTTQDATGRCGIAIIHDFLDVQGYTNTTRPSPTDPNALEVAYFEAGKLEHVIVEDCYVHDVTGLHPKNGAKGGGSKMSGGILSFGPYDDLKIEGNVVMYCDVEGIRNDVLAWKGDTRTQFPRYMEGVSISNNFIVGVPGDGVVISCAIEPRLANNYLSDAGYSFFSSADGLDWSNSSFKIAEMGNRGKKTVGGVTTGSDPITFQDTNFAGLWFIGTLDAVAEYNESVNNVWTCNDGEAFDADMFCLNTVFQHNYTYRNNGGFCLFMGGGLAMDAGTIARYNVSVEDGMGVGSGAGKKGIFYYNGTPDAIYNNLFIIGASTKSMFGGDSNTTNFFNNIVVSPDGSRTDFIFNGSGGNDTTRNALNGSVRNNLFYPAEILTNTTGGFTNTGNITPADASELPFYDLDAFMTAQPIQALNGRGAHVGTVSYTKVLDKGNGTAITAEAGRSVTAPDGTGFDYTNFEGIKTVESASTIGAGIPVHADYLNSVHVLTRDFFNNDITGITTPDIGPYQWSADSNHYLSVVFMDNGADTPVAAKHVLAGGTVSLPTPTRAYSVFDGWYTTSTFDEGTLVSGSYTVGTTGATLYAKWSVGGDFVEVTFDSQEGSSVAPYVVAKNTVISAPAEPTRAGATFEGWYKDSACTMLWNFGTEAVTSSITLYAKWYIIPTFTITFDSQGATTAATPDEYIVEEGEKLPALPSMPLRDGYGFAGWYTEQNGGGTQFTADSEITTSMTLYAKWERTITNLLKFDGDLKFDGSESTITSVGTPSYVADHAGTANSAVKLDESNYLMLTNDEMPVDYSENFTIAFWYQRESSTGDPVIFGNRSWQSGDRAGFTYSVLGNQIRLCATPTINGSTTRANIDFSVPTGAWAHIATTFNLTEGKITVYVDGVKAASYNYNATIESMNSSDLRPTYWAQGTRNSASELYNGSSNKLTAYMDDFFMTQRVLTENDIADLMTGTPAAITYDVGFNTMGGSSVDSIFDVVAGAQIVEPAAPTKTGYNFVGWFKEEACTNAWDFAVDTVSANVVLYAKWEAVVVTPPPSGGTSTTYYTVSETYVDEDGKTLKSATSKSVASGGKYERSAPAIEGYTLLKVLINGEAGEVALIERVKAKATVVFVYAAETTLVDGEVPLSDGSTISTVIDAAADCVIITKKDAAGSVIAEIMIPRSPAGSHSFTDVPASHWANDAVGYAAAQNLFSGVNATTFAGDQKTTRGMMVTVLHRFAGEAAGGSVSFADVVPGSWYANAASWGETQRIVLGFDDGLFRPDTLVTREQAVAFLYRFAISLNGDAATAELSGYQDADSVSTWAADAMAWAVEQGIVQGKDGNRLAPQDTLTRYELALMMERLSNYFVK